MAAPGMVRACPAPFNGQALAPPDPSLLAPHPHPPPNCPQAEEIAATEAPVWERLSHYSSGWHRGESMAALHLYRQEVQMGHDVSAASWLPVCALLLSAASLSAASNSASMPPVRLTGDALRAAS